MNVVHKIEYWNLLGLKAQCLSIDRYAMRARYSGIFPQLKNLHNAVYTLTVDPRIE
jgi:hypothetical protein